MINKKQNKDVKECRVLGGIDTLYAFIDTDKLSIESKELYHNLWLSVKDGLFFRDGYKFLNFSGKTKGFIGGWYSHTKDNIPLYRIGFKDDTKQKNVKNIYLQLEASGIYYMGFFELINYIKIELSNLLNYQIINEHILPSRVDLNAFVGGYDFSNINSKMFKTKLTRDNDINQDENVVINYDEYLKSYSFANRQRLETLYLGSKSSNMYLKIYDKNKELKNADTKISSQVKKYFLLEQGFTYDEVWNIEFTIKRLVLKEFLIFNLDDLLEKAGALFKKLMTQNAFLGYDIEMIKAFRDSKNISKLELHEIWKHIIDNYNFCNHDNIDLVRFRTQYKKGSKHYASMMIKKYLKDQIRLEQSFTVPALTQLLREADKEVLNE